MVRTSLQLHFQMMEQLADHHYEVLSVPEESAANCVYVRGPSNQNFLLHRPAEECPDSIAVRTTTTLNASDHDLLRSHIFEKFNW